MKTTFRSFLFAAFLFPCVSCAHEDASHGDVSKKIAEIEADFEKLRKTLDERAKELQAMYDKELKELAGKLSTSQAESQTKDKEIAALNKLMDVLKGEKQKDTKKIIELEADLAEMKARVTGSHAALDRLRQNIAELSKEIGGPATAAKPARTGAGEHVYEVVPNWPKYPKGKALGSLHGDVAADSKGNVYIAVGDTIQVVGIDGEYKRDLGKAWGGVHGMKVRREGSEEFLFVAQSSAKRVAKLHLDGRIVWEIVGHPKVEGMYAKPNQYNPTDVDITSDGTIYVVDGYGKSLVHIYDKNRKYQKTFGGKGKENGKFNVCHNIIIDTRQEKPTLLISDRQNNRLQLHAMDGTFIKTIDAELRQPCAADIHGDLLAVGELGGRLSLYDKNNKLLARLGDEPAGRKKGNGAPPDSWVEGALVAVHGCTFDMKGDLYAQEWNRFGRIVKYTPVK